jgi:hypothetical protein
MRSSQSRAGLKRSAENLFNCSTLCTAGAVKESVLVLVLVLVRASTGRECAVQGRCGGEVVGAGTGLKRAESAVVGTTSLEERDRGWWRWCRWSGSRKRVSAF